MYILPCPPTLPDAIHRVSTLLPTLPTLPCLLPPPSCYLVISGIIKILTQGNLIHEY